MSSISEPKGQSSVSPTGRGSGQEADAEAFDAALAATDEAGGEGDTRSGFDATIGAAGDAFAGAGGIDRLNSDGDQVRISVRGEAKLQVGVGLKGQYGYHITVTQNGGAEPGKIPAPNDPPARYDVSFDSDVFAGLAVDLPIPLISGGSENGLRGTDRVTMSFDTKEDAARAVTLLEREALASTVKDTAALSPGVLPGPGIGPGTGSPDLGNPLLDPPDAGPTLDPGELAARAAAERIGPSDDDRAWLRENITSISTTVTFRGRDKAEVSLQSIGLPGPALEARFDRLTGVTRTVELGEGGEPVRLSYEVTGGVNLSSKAKLNLGSSLGLSGQLRGEHGMFEARLGVAWALPDGAARDTRSAGGRPLPEGYGIGSGDLGAPDEASVVLTGTLQDEALLDPSRNDFRRVTVEATVDDPTQTAGAMLGEILRGDLEGAVAAGLAPTALTARAERVASDGVNVQGGPTFNLGNGVKAEATLIVQTGIDDVMDRQGLEVRTDAPPVERTDLPRGDVLVVTPEDGLNLRDTPGGAVIDAFRHGTFLERTGEAISDAEGGEWIPVQGLTDDGALASGWVSSDHLRLHPAATGAMAGTGAEAGRINPTLEGEGFLAYTAAEGDTLWDIAQAHNVDFAALVATNEAHLLQPSLIFAGDRVYIPGTAGTVERPDAAPQVEPATSSEERVTTSASGQGAETATPRVPTQSAPTQSDPTDEAPAADPADDATVAPAAGPLDARPDLGDIRRRYQVEEDPNGRVDWRPSLGQFEAPQALDPIARRLLGRDLSISLLDTEGEMLSDLRLDQQADFIQISSDAMAQAREAFPMPDTWPGSEADWANDGHMDAFRHSYWSARLTQRFGPEWARAYTTAHEAVPGNEATREAMDLYNNAVGIEIAVAHPDASPNELARLLSEALADGKVLVVDARGGLAWSDQVAVGQHGTAEDLPLPGAMPLPEPGTARVEPLR